MAEKHPSQRKKHAQILASIAFIFLFMTIVHTTFQNIQCTYKHGYSEIPDCTYKGDYTSLALMLLAWSEVLFILYSIEFGAPKDLPYTLARKLGCVAIIVFVYSMLIYTGVLLLKIHAPGFVLPQSLFEYISTAFVAVFVSAIMFWFFGIANLKLSRWIDEKE